MKGDKAFESAEGCIYRASLLFAMAVIGGVCVVTLAFLMSYLLS